MNTPITYGMVGGSLDAFIGNVHRQAIALDGKAYLRAGCFSRDNAKNQATGRALFVETSRVYKDYNAMAQAESQRADGIDMVVIVTPNISHYPIAKSFLEAGISVVCDKPLTTSSEQAKDLITLAEKQDLLFGVTYTYSGYPLIREARELIQQGVIGDIRFVQAQYIQEWLATSVEQEGNKQASWRTDPNQSGISNCVGDIGSHIEHTISFVTGLKISRLSARLDSFGEGRTLDDNASILVEYQGGAKGLYWCSQIAIGHDNDLGFHIYGTKGAISWRQEAPNYLELTTLDGATRRISRGRDALSPMADSLVRLPSGHPEGYFEAFANIYVAIFQALQCKKAGKPWNNLALDFPNLQDGLAGVTFIEKCVESSRADAQWVHLA